MIETNERKDLYVLKTLRWQVFHNREFLHTISNRLLWVLATSVRPPCNQSNSD